MTEYQAMTNKQLLELAREQGLNVTADWNNRLTIVRGIVSDAESERDRQQFIEWLRAHDEAKGRRSERILQAAGLGLAVLSLVLTLLLAG